MSRERSARSPTPRIRPSQTAMAGPSAGFAPASGRRSRRSTRPCASPRRTPPASVTTSAAPVTRSPGRSSSVRPPAMTRRVTTREPQAARASPRSTGNRRRPWSPLAAGASRLEPELERLQRAEVAQPEEAGGRGQPVRDRRIRGGIDVVGDVEERSHGRKPDELRFVELDPVLGGLGLHGLPDAPEGRGPEIEHVHRDLGLLKLVDEEAVRLDLWEAAARFPNAAGNAL